jgi:hypothetical protein
MYKKVHLAKMDRPYVGIRKIHTDKRLVLFLAGAVCVVWEFAPVQTYACVGLYLIYTVT